MNFNSGAGLELISSARLPQTLSPTLPHLSTTTSPFTGHQTLNMTYHNLTQCEPDLHHALTYHR